jgi:NADH-quinone oxidoreductase subunit N
MEIAIPPLDVLVVAPEIVVFITALLVVLPSHVLPGHAGDMLVADGYALFLNLVILTAAALAILFSVEYVSRVEQAPRMGLAQGEYYTLLLLSTTGMMLMAAAVNLMTIFLALEILSIALYVLWDGADLRRGWHHLPGWHAPGLQSGAPCGLAWR